jgi:hypothetical protein
VRTNAVGLSSSAFLALLGACADDSASHRPTHAAHRHVASESCPLKTPADWRRFVETTVEDESWVKTCSIKAVCDEGITALMARVQTDVIDLFDRCVRDLADNPPIARCTAPLRRFVPAWVRQHAVGSYGFVQNNRAYLAAQTGPDTPPGMMDPPAAIVAALPERAKIEQTARVQGWPYLTHDSCFGEIRTFVTVADPDDRFEQWMLVGLDAAATLVEDGSILSFIGVQKRDTLGQKLERVRLHFRDYSVSSGGSWSLVLPQEHTGKCFACHGSGMRLLIPTHGTVVASAPVRGEPGYGTDGPADFGFQRLSELNRRLLSYGLPDWNGSVEPADHGPPLGESLGCTACHNGLVRGVLTVFTDEETLKRKIVDELSMRSSGPGKSVPDETAIALLDRERTGAPALSLPEQAALDRARAEHLADYQAFVAERFPAWKAWALSERCE